MRGKDIGLLLGVATTTFVGGIALGHKLAQKRVQKTIDSQLNKFWHESRPIGRFKTIEKTDEGIKVEGEFNKDHPSVPDLIETLKVGEMKLHSWGPTTDPGAPGHIVSVTPVGPDPELEALLDEEDHEIAERKLREANVFDNGMPEWDYASELNRRMDQTIYTITHDEFFGNERTWKQDQLTYYQGDDMLCDQLNVPIYNYRKLVGEELKFGHGSKDPNIVFIRNELEEIEFEICLDEGSYEAEILGLTIDDDYTKDDLKHSAMPQRFHLRE